MREGVRPLLVDWLISFYVSFVGGAPPSFTSKKKKLLRACSLFSPSLGSSAHSALFAPREPSLSAVLSLHATRADGEREERRGRRSDKERERAVSSSLAARIDRSIAFVFFSPSSFLLPLSLSVSPLQMADVAAAAPPAAAAPAPPDERAAAIAAYRRVLVLHAEADARARALRDAVRGLRKDHDKTEDDLKALQSVGQIIGEVLRQLDAERCEQEKNGVWWRDGEREGRKDTERRGRRESMTSVFSLSTDLSRPRHLTNPKNSPSRFLPPSLPLPLSPPPPPETQRSHRQGLQRTPLCRRLPPASPRPGRRKGPGPGHARHTRHDDADDHAVAQEGGRPGRAQHGGRGPREGGLFEHRRAGGAGSSSCVFFTKKKIEFGGGGEGEKRRAANLGASSSCWSPPLPPFPLTNKPKKTHRSARSGSRSSSRSSTRSSSSASASSPPRASCSTAPLGLGRRCSRGPSPPTWTPTS